MSRNPLISVATGLHKASEELTPLLLRQAAQVYLGKPIHLARYEEVTAIRIEDDKLMVSTIYLKLREHNRSTEVLAAYVRGYVWTASSDGGWDPKPEMFEVEDESFREYTIIEGRKVITPDEYYRDLDWASMCYRPGTKKTPMDSPERARQDESTEAMNKHWKDVNAYDDALNLNSFD